MSRSSRDHWIWAGAAAAGLLGAGVLGQRRFKRKINPHVSVDQGLIGGVRIAVGDEVIDGSVRGKLAAMAAGLAKI